MKLFPTRIVITMLAAALWSMAASGCNTLRGLGQDIENACRGIQRSAS